MLEVSHFSKRYGRTLAVSDVTFTLADGTVTVLLGPNGAGKSTLMKGMIGFLRFEGSVLVNGLPNATPESRRQIGYVPEIPSFYPNLTVSEHFEFVARAYRMAGGHKERQDELLERFALKEHARKLGSELSKGMAQKLNICLGLFLGPKVLLLDEPFIGLDPHAIKELKACVAERAASGATLLVSTHIIESVDLIFDRALIMSRGEVVKDVEKGALAELGVSLEELFFAATEGTGSTGSADA